MTPKIVDRDSRRREIVDAYLSLIAREGMTHASSRALATKLGMANGALWHYFDSKDDLLAQAARRIVDNTDHRINASVGDNTGLVALELMLRELLPLDRVTQNEARVIVNFWGLTAMEGIYHERRNPEIDRWTAQAALHIEQASHAGEYSSRVSIDTLAVFVMSFVTAAQVNYVVGGEELADPIKRVRELLQIAADAG